MAADARRRARNRVLALSASAVTIACAALGSALAEDTGRWEVLLGNAPGMRPGGFRLFGPPPGFRNVAPPPLRIERVAPAEDRPAPAAKATPPDPAKRENPLALLLADRTLRYGDIVVFPDGPRVFRGEPGSRHSVHDFVSLARSKEGDSAGRRKLLAMPIGDNDAWSSDLSGRSKVAGKADDVEATGSIRPAGKSVTVRTGRGDVRVIRVPN
jgi:hypothetical protein